MSAEQLSVRDAIEYLDGHTLLSVDGARMACQALGVELDEKLIIVWETAQEAWDKWGFHATISPGRGVDGLRLSYHVASALEIDPPGHAYTGVGFQSQANRRAIRQKLSELGKL